jgi:hypothetical protein
MGSSRSSRQQRSQFNVIERLEGRALLSVVTSSLPPAVAAVDTVPIAASPTIHVDGFPVQPSAPETPVALPKAMERHAKSAGASASDFASVGKNYLKTIFSSATGKVTWSYLKAAVRGNGKQLTSLGHTSAVKQLGQNFKNLGSSSQVKAVGNSFNNLGNSIYKQYHKIIK